MLSVNPIALRTAKTQWSIDCSECNRVNEALNSQMHHAQKHCLFLQQICEAQFVKALHIFCSKINMKKRIVISRPMGQMKKRNTHRKWMSIGGILLFDTYIGLLD